MPGNRAMLSGLGSCDLPHLAPSADPAYLTISAAACSLSAMRQAVMLAAPAFECQKIRFNFQETGSTWQYVRLSVFVLGL